MRALYVTSEIFPYVKTGGLGDVSAALPPALAEIGIDIRLLVPNYPNIQAATEKRTFIKSIRPPFLHYSINLYKARLPDSGLIAYIIDAPPLYSREGNPYLDANGNDWPDNHLRFATLSWVAAYPIDPQWEADIVHTHDWHTGLTAFWLQQLPQPRPVLLHTIHNLAFKGSLSASQCIQLGIPSAIKSFMQSAVEYADKIGTVSPQYAQDIQIPCANDPQDLAEILSIRKQDVVGILNGIDSQIWNPATDHHIAHTYDSKRLHDKARNKANLQAILGLTPDPNAMLFCVVSRMSSQKGLDLILAAIPSILSLNAQLVILGKGDIGLEQAFLQAEQEHPQAIAVEIGYDENSAHRYIAAADAILIPSRFEPCGLTQLYGLRYGTLPIVTPVGGLADSVEGADLAQLDKEATGFFAPTLDSAGLIAAIHDAHFVYRHTEFWPDMQKLAMRQDFSWRKSAHSYKELYKNMIQNHTTL